MDNPKQPEKFVLPYKTRLEIANDLGISLRTLNRRIKELKIDLSRKNLLSPKEYLPIYQAILGNGFDESYIYSLAQAK
jgi:hypothetical protein